MINIAEKLKMILRKMFYFILIILFFQSCKDESIISPDETNNQNTQRLVKVIFDLQGGFSGEKVLVYTNQGYLYQSNLSTIQSLAGPQAMFTTYLAEGKTNLNVMLLGNQISSYKTKDSSIVEIGKKDIYYVGLLISENKLSCRVQDSSFVYY